MIDRRVSLLVALCCAVAAATLPSGAAAAERVVLSGSSGDVFSPSNGVFLETGEGEAEAEAEFETASEYAADVEAADEFESEAEAEAVAEAEFEADEEAFDMDVEADEEADESVDADAQITLQQYAEAQGATDAEGESEAEEEVAVALDALSSEATLSEAESEMEAELEAEAGPEAGKAGAPHKKHHKKHHAHKHKHSPGMKMSQLNLRDDSGEGAKINLAQGKGRYSMGVNPAGVFSVDMEGRTVLSVSGKSGMVRARGDVTVWNTLSAGSLTLNRVPQWKMVRSDSFDRFTTLPKRPIGYRETSRKGLGKAARKAAEAAANTSGPQVSAADAAAAPKPPAPGAAAGTSGAASASAGAPPPATSALEVAAQPTAAAKALAKKARGWLYDDVIRCNGLSMLSAKPGRTVSTRYSRLPRHTQLRVVATVHFIDDWQGETGWLKLNDQFVWTESVDQKGVTGKFSVCGSPQYPESRFSAPIDVVWPHTAKHLTLSFGSNLDDGSDARFALSNVAIYTRDNTPRKKRHKTHKKVLIPKCRDPKDAACAKRRADAIAKVKAQKAAAAAAAPASAAAATATPAAPAPAPVPSASGGVPSSISGLRF